jgi:hypothetical protein
MSDPKQGKTDSSGKPSTESAGTVKTLDDLRAEYERSVAEAAQNGKDKGSNDSEIKAMRAEIEKLRDAEADRSYRHEMTSFIVPTVGADLGVNVDIVEMWVNRQAAADPELMTLWNARGEKPKEFKAAIEALKPEFAKFAETNGLAKKDPEPKGKGPAKTGKSVESAVRSARQTDAGKATDLASADLNSMSDSEFAMHAQKVYALSRAGQLQ